MVARRRSVPSPLTPPNSDPSSQHAQLAEENNWVDVAIIIIIMATLYMHIHLLPICRDDFGTWHSLAIELTQDTWSASGVSLTIQTQTTSFFQWLSRGVCGLILSYREGCSH